MTSDRIDDHKLLLARVMAPLSAERGFIVLRNPATGSPSEFIVSHNFDLTLYVRAIGETREKNSVSNDEYYHLSMILQSILTQGQPALINNLSAEVKTYGIILPWPLRYVIGIPLQDNGEFYGLLWCDRKIRPRLWKEEDLNQAAALVHDFYEER
jgi:GAF domain-containing protein